MKQYDKFEIEALGTLISIYLLNSNQKLFEEIKNIILTFQKEYSRFSSESKVTFLNQNKYDFCQINSELFDILQKSLVINEKTQGYFDITLNSTLNKLGYKDQNNLTSSKIKEYLTLIKNFGNSIKLENNSCRLSKNIDLGGIGKGYLIDKLRLFLIKKNIKEFTINAGGDIYIHSNKRRKVFLEHPTKDNFVFGEIEIKNLSFCSSSPKYRKFKNNHHLINPKTKKSSFENSQIYILHKSATFADAYATAFFVMPTKKAIEISKKLNLAILIIDKNNKIYKSENFKCIIYN